MSNLLEEAIIDAKALKEAALKSAQEAVLDKYNPEVKKAIENILLEQDELSPDTSGDMLDAPQAGAGTLNGQIPLAATNDTNLCPCPDDNKVIEIDFDQLQKALSTVDAGTGATNDMSQPLVPPMAPVEEPAAQTPSPETVSAGEEAEEEPTQIPLEEDEEIELDEELLNSLLEDEDLFIEDERYQGLRMQDVPEEKIKDHKTDAQIAHIATELARKLVTKQLRENKQTKEVKKLNEARVLEQKNSQLLEEHKKIISENKLLVEENARLQKEQSEMMASALEFSKQLRDLNLLNAKLFYKNQALSSNSLNERQKNKIVEAISKADSVDEVKIIFETLQSAVGSAKTTNEPKSLSEAVTRNTGFNIRTREKEVPTTNPAFDRWAKIAGIKK